MSFLATHAQPAENEAGRRPIPKEQLIRELEAALGAEWVTSDPCVLDTYIWQYVAEAVTGTHYMPRPIAVVMPANTEEVAAVVRICNRLGAQYKAMSTGFGMWNSPFVEDRVVQIDLRRMDRFVKIDRDNMCAVIEPYVTGNQLQTEAMKVGLNTHIAGCGAQCSVLASATSMMGQGWDGISMGFSNRNLLGFEWVTPGGEIVQVGSFDAAGEAFAGDGPGFSLRGIIRGFGGALGGLGVFTRCAVKLYPWDGPEALEFDGRSPRYDVRIPAHHTAAVLVVNDWRGMAELGYRLGEAEIVTYLARNAPSMLAGGATVTNNEAAEVYAVPMMHELYHALCTICTAAHAAEARYKRKVLKQILRETDGGMISNDLSPSGAWSFLRFLRVIHRRVGTRKLLASVPGFVAMVYRDVQRLGVNRIGSALPASLYQSMVRSGMNMRGIFRFAGTFWTAMGSLVAWDNAIRGARVGAQIKKKYIDQGVIVDDGADNAWGGLYEGGHYAHLEELAMYDQRDPVAAQRVTEYVAETNLACIEYHCGDSLNAIGPPAHALFSPACMDYDRFAQRIKAEFDPNNAADASFYTDPGFRPDEDLQQRMAAVLAERAPIRIDTSHGATSSA